MCHRKKASLILGELAGGFSPLHLVLFGGTIREEWQRQYYLRDVGGGGGQTGSWLVLQPFLQLFRPYMVPAIFALGHALSLRSSRR